MSGGPWRAGGAAVPLRSWRTAQLADVADSLGAAWRRWAQEWEVPADAGAAVACRCASGDLVASDRWVEIGTRADARAWLQWSGHEGKHLGAAWFDDDEADTPVVRELVDAALADLRQCFARALQLRESTVSAPPAADRLGPWSGAVVAELRWGGLVLMEAAVVEPLLAASTRVSARPLVRLGEAMARIDLHLGVDLQGCELPMGALQSLQAGDVLRLAHRVDAPATVVDDHCQPLFQAWLARSRGRRAVELAPLPR